MLRYLIRIQNSNKHELLRYPRNVFDKRYGTKLVHPMRDCLLKCYRGAALLKESENVIQIWRYY